MRVLLAICLLGIALLASFFLRQRKLTMVETLAWGMLILLVPLLGPFLVILVRPGSKSMPAN
jgi:ABC-type transport system involved in multi-copper enzyme maturation permease subunit